MVTTIILFKGLKAPVTQIITIVLAFLVICLGITILQMSKIDPKNFEKLDRRSTILLQAARSHTADPDDEKAELSKVEDPGIDTLRGSFGAVGSIIRARTVRRMSQSSRMSRNPATLSGTWDPHHFRGDSTFGAQGLQDQDRLSGLKRHQLYDAPVPRPFAENNADRNSTQSLTPKRPTIKFGAEDLVHSYNRPGTGDNTATHEHRPTLASPSAHSGYPPLPPLPPQGPLVQVDSPEEYRNSNFSNVAGIGAGGDGDYTIGGSMTAVASATDLSFDKDKHRDSTDSQLLSYPPLLSKEHQVHSAPATVYDRYRQPQPPRKDSREIFERQPSAIRETLLSFPSVTDSALSQDWTEETLEQMQLDERRKAAGGRLGKNQSTSSLAVQSHATRDKSKERKEKKYPKAHPDSDLEESESLWRKSLENESEEGPTPAASVRLVQRK